MPPAAEIRNEIARLKRQMREWAFDGRLDSDVETEMKAEIADLEDDLTQLLDMTEDLRAAPTAGLDEALFFAAFGRTPAEEFA